MDSQQKLRVNGESLFPDKEGDINLFMYITNEEQIISFLMSAKTELQVRNMWRYILENTNGIFPGKNVYNSFIQALSRFY